MFLANVVSSSTMSTAGDISVGGSQQQLDRRSPTDLAFDRDRAAEPAHDALRECEAHSQPLRLAGAERLEDLVELIGGNADSRVVDRDLDGPVLRLLPRSDRELSAVRHRLQRVREQAVQ